jgi:hypothetical protein
VHQRPQPLSGKCTAAEGEDDVVAIGTAPKDGPEQRGSGQRAATIDQRQSSQLGREPCQRVAATIAGERAVEDLGEMEREVADGWATEGESWRLVGEPRCHTCKRAMSRRFGFTGLAG